MGFQNQLQKAMDILGLTQSELAKKTNMKQSHISHFVRGKRKPSLDNFIRIRNVLGISADTLLGLNENWGRELTHKDSLVRQFNKLNLDKQRAIIKLIESMEGTNE